MAIVLPVTDIATPIKYVKGYYEMNLRQFTAMDTGANNKEITYLVPMPNERDDIDKSLDLEKLNKEFDDLQTMGLVIDVTDKCTDTVKEAWETHGRVIRVFFPSPQSIMLFKRGNEKVI